MNGKRRVDLIHWGLPSWCKEVGKLSTHNARGEELAEKVPHPGFTHEWTDTKAPKVEGGAKRHLKIRQRTENKLRRSFTAQVAEE